jgi:hypothetical protein
MMNYKKSPKGWGRLDTFRTFDLENYKFIFARFTNKLSAIC